MRGLGLLPLNTLFEAEKRVQRVSGHIVCERFRDIDVNGYEIHLGRTTPTEPIENFIKIQDHLDGAVKNNGQIIGCYLHNIFHTIPFGTAG